MRRLIVIFGLCVCMASSGCLVDCGDITLAQTQSADGIYGARAYYIDCGAIGEFSLNIRLTTKVAYGYTSQRDVLNVMGRFTARFDWPQSRLLRVTITCAGADQCPGDDVANLRKALASSDRAWRELKIEYILQ